MQPKRMVHWGLLLAALLGGMAAVPGLRAQPAARKVDNRFLFVFDTSAEMKRRVPAVQVAITNILTTSAGGQLHSNDTIGVWTFNQEVRTGQFPLQRWKPDQVATMAKIINVFVGSQRFAKKTSFEALVPRLNQIVQSSERLAVVVFCDGYEEIHGTPYDVGLNQVFKQHQSERQKSRQPIVIVLISQLGQYVDCTVSFPPQLVSFPQFPPLPEAVVVAPKKAPAPAPPRPSLPPLIVIGTPITNRAPVSAPQPVVPASSPPPATSTPAPAPVSEVSPVDEAPLTRPGGGAAQLKIAPGLLPQTNAVSPPAERAVISRTKAFAMGVAFLVVAGGLVVLLSSRGRR